MKNLQWVDGILFWIGKTHDVAQIQTMFLNYYGCGKVGSVYSLNGMGSLKLVALLQFLG